MKLKLLFLFCMPLLFTGCLGEGPWVTYHYVYRNMTDKVINVVGCIVDDNDNVVKIDSSFSILPFLGRLMGISIFILFLMLITLKSLMVSK